MTGFGDGGTGATNRSGSVSSGNNSSGLTVTHDRVGGRPFVNVEYDVGGNATIAVEGRYELPDGSFTDWQEYTSVDTSNANTDNDDIIQLPWVGYAEVRATTSTTGIDVEFIINATR